MKRQILTWDFLETYSADLREINGLYNVVKGVKSKSGDILQTYSADLRGRSMDCVSLWPGRKGFNCSPSREQAHQSHFYGVEYFKIFI